MASWTCATRTAKRMRTRRGGSIGGAKFSFLPVSICLWTTLFSDARISGKPTTSVAAFASTAGSRTSSWGPHHKQRHRQQQRQGRLKSHQDFTIHESMSDLLKDFDYDALILDQFGVMHNGKNPLDGALECVRTLEQQRKLLIVLSNTSSPSKTTLQRLDQQLGFDKSWFLGAITSGEEAARYIRETFGSTGEKKKFVWFTWDVDNENVPNPIDFLDLCGSTVEPTLDLDQADFVIAHGSGAIRGYDANGEMKVQSMGNFLNDGNLETGTPIDAMLRACADRGLPLVCANPDEVVVYHDGSLKHMPGKIALKYSSIWKERVDENTPTIRIFGKPHKEHFEACLRELELAASSPSPLRVAHVGDSLHHDVAGAKGAGVPSIFIVGGIHAEELLADEDGGVVPSRKALEDFFEKEGHTPTHVLPLFQY